MIVCFSRCVETHKISSILFWRSIIKLFEQDFEQVLSKKWVQRGNLSRSSTKRK